MGFEEGFQHFRHAKYIYIQSDPVRKRQIVSLRRNINVKAFSNALLSDSDALWMRARARVKHRAPIDLQANRRRLRVHSCHCSMAIFRRSRQFVIVTETSECDVALSL